MLERLWKSGLVSVLLAGFVSPAVATNQDGEANSPVAPPAPAPLKQGRPIGLEFSYAPTIAGEEPFTLGDSVSEYTSLTARLFVDFPVGEDMKVTLDGGASVGLDWDDDSSDEGGSSIFAGAKFAWNRPLRRISPYVSYRFEHGFDANLPELIGVDDYNQHRFAIGAQYQTNSWVCAESHMQLTLCPDETGAVRVGAELARTYSDVEGRERWTPQLSVEGKVHFIAGIDLTGSSTIEYRRFDRIDGLRREDVRGVVFGGLDFARAIGRDFIKELSIGARWVESDSNVDGKDVSQWNVVPKITLRFTF